MKKILLITAVFLILAGLSGGLTAAFAYNNQDGPGSQQQAIDLAVGDTYEVALESNGTTGYQWLVECDENFLEIVDRCFEVDSDLVGAAGKQVFLLRAVGAGTIDVVFKYQRPWEDEVLKSKTYTFNISK
ncbi:protease inhibitor I42 family protein [Chloroflexota bacterium]